MTQGEQERIALRIIDFGKPISLMNAYALTPTLSLGERVGVRVE